SSEPGLPPASHPATSPAASTAADRPGPATPAPPPVPPVPADLPPAPAPPHAPAAAHAQAPSPVPTPVRTPAVAPTPVQAAAAAAAQTPAPPPAPQDPPRRPLAVVLDATVLDDLESMLGEEVDKLVDVFLDDSPRLIRTLENAAGGPDYDALRDAAHSLKSSSANLGALSLSAAAKRVELAARERSLERPAVAVALIANEFARARQQLLARRETRL